MTTMIHSFEPVAGADARVLVLGTLPSAASLEVGHNYGHPRNAFWYIVQALAMNGREEVDAALESGDVGSLIVIDPARLLGFEERRQMLVDNGIALWDCLRAARRDGSSLDSAIDVATEVPNDIAGFLRCHPQVRAVFFNGAKAESVFRRLIAPRIAEDGELAADLERRSMRYVRLPSTSPAFAGMGLAEKLRAWSAIMIEPG